MKKVAVVGGGPQNYLPDLGPYRHEISFWIGADRGALSLINNGITPDLSVGDFDSVNMKELERIKLNSKRFELHRSEKDETDLELAVTHAVNLHPDSVYLFGVTGGRLDHELANLQLLYLLNQKRIEGVILDYLNKVKMVFSGTHSITKNASYPYVSFIPFSPEVKGITLSNFRYPLQSASLTWGSTRCISNEVLEENGLLTFNEGILYVIESRDYPNDG